MPKRRYHFAAGHVANRILDALSQCSFAQIASLGRKGVLDVEQFNHGLSHQALNYKGLSDYATLSGVPVISFFYAENSTANPAYTPYDDEVRTFIRSLNPHVLKKLHGFIMDAFYLDSYSLSGNPSDKIHHLLKYRADVRAAGKSEEPLVLPDYKTLQTDLKQELWRYAVKNRGSNKVTFQSDYYADLAVYLGVSLHWIMSMDVPFLFNTQLEDEIYDCFTLMTPAMQEVFVEMIAAYVQDEMDRLANIAANLRRNG